MGVDLGTAPFMTAETFQPSYLLVTAHAWGLRMQIPVTLAQDATHREGRPRGEGILWCLMENSFPTAGCNLTDWLPISSVEEEIPVNLG